MKILHLSLRVSVLQLDIAAGRADLCALARPHLSDPFWTLHAAAELGYAGQRWPPQYLTGRRQLERILQKKAAST